VFNRLARSARHFIESLSQATRYGVEAGVYARGGRIGDGVEGAGGYADGFVQRACGRVDAAADDAGGRGLAWCGMSFYYDVRSGVGSFEEERGSVLEGWGRGAGLPSGFTVFLAGVDFVVVLFTGVGAVVFLSVVMVFEAGLAAVSFFTAVGFVVTADDFEALLMGVFVPVTGVFLTGVDAPAGLLAEATGTVFCVPRGVLGLTGVAFAGTGAFGCAGVEADAPAALSFLGALLTGTVAVPVVLVAGVAGCLTGVALVTFELTALVGPVVAFFAVCPVP
jgi:hypothetical protein